MPKLVYLFGGGRAEGSGAMKDLLGGKGAGLAEMCRAGAPVPPGFTVTTEACRAYRRRPARGLAAVPGLTAAIGAALRRLERAAGRRFGDPADPLLVSVRSGAKFSMPGMMDTILNLGLNGPCGEGLARASGDRPFALESYRRLVAMFGAVVRGVPKERFEAARVPDPETALSRTLEAYRREAGRDFPADPREQLFAAVEAVFRSWDNARAVVYRKANGIPEDLGTACTVQAMVFGNRGPASGTGVGFTRDPATGRRVPYGEYLPDAQGEDVVAGVRTPMPLAELRRALPAVHRRLLAVTGGLERRLKDAQDYEFTVERGRLYLLQTHAAKRTAAAALRMAVDMTRERLIGREEALLRVDPATLDQLLKPVFDERARKGHAVLAKGLPAGPGAATGHIVFSADAAVEAAKRGPVLLVRPETNPDDIHGMMAAAGILTATGGLTSHAAVVGRGMGKVCVVGCGELEIGEGTLKVGGKTLKEGDYLSLDGFSGEVLWGEVATMPSEVLRCLDGTLPAARSELFRYYRVFMGWADAARRLGVRANADTPADAKAALMLGAEGIGLCRTEHMFFGADRVPKMLAMIVAETPQERHRALAALFPLQKEDFKALLREMAGYPVTIRFFDPPLHEFLPHGPEEAQRRAAAAGVDPAKVWDAARRLKEMNPMLGHRGCRLGVTHPEITAMQARAALTAVKELRAEGVRAEAELMVPLVGTPGEFSHQEALVRAEARKVFGRARGPFSVGTMIEVPRACLVAEAVAREAEFFSFGTNDLTQMTLGYSRDDYGKFIGEYLELGLLARDPFAGVDEEGVGELVRTAVARGRRGRPGLECGVCGEHGGDPASIAFFHRAGLDYVSCSPYRVPAARLAAAQAAVRERRARREYSTA